MERPIARDVGRLFALGSVLHVEADFLVFLQRFEACCIHFGEVGEQILAAVIRRIDAQTSRIVQSLDRTRCLLEFLIIKKGRFQ
jgi:hypothetical protein